MLLAASESPGRAEIDADIFAGAHLWSGDNRLSRADNPTDGNVFAHSGLFGLRLAYVPIPHLAIEGELAILPTSTIDESSRLGVLAVRGHLLVNLLTGRFRPFVLAGGGGMISMPTVASPLKSDAEGELHAGVGFKIDFVPNWGLRLDGRAVFPQGLSQTFTAEGEVLIGFYGRFGVARKVPLLMPPPPPPLPPTAVDRDNDGVPDSEDRCPDAPGPRENGGCPDQDSDGDGVPDRLDRCPGLYGSSANQGCPEPDTDHDGVPDRLDRCPTVAGSPANAGCPEEAAKPLPKALAPFSGTIAGITFEPYRAIITVTSYPTLDQAVALLKEHGNVRVQIAGYTDSSGDPDQNRALSQARADAVRQYLIDKGIAPERLTAIGYGPDKPLFDNATAAGRAKNRRVEFILIPGP
jgi:outer membrane protein OmpA-like peptidoglycan-associated protein